MSKSIGILLLASSILALLAGAFIDINYRATAQITGRAAAMPATGAFDYLEGFIFSYSIISLIMGMIFLFRV
ncbi:hypothetical protein HY637_03100 [Candidatus Woesearchaeota archaeon]|nr:hypothetical protein [Candidatus Woesearchaeota archaeon]